MRAWNIEGRKDNDCLPLGKYGITCISLRFFLLFQRAFACHLRTLTPHVESTNNKKLFKKEGGQVNSSMKWKFFVIAREAWGSVGKRRIAVFDFATSATFKRYRTNFTRDRSIFSLCSNGTLNREAYKILVRFRCFLVNGTCT